MDGIMTFEELVYGDLARQLSEKSIELAEARTRNILYEGEIAQLQELVDVLQEEVSAKFREGPEHVEGEESPTKG